MGTDLLKIEGQCCIPNFQSAVERESNINTISPAQRAPRSGWGGIPGVVHHPLKLSRFATRMRTFMLVLCCGRCRAGGRNVFESEELAYELQLDEILSKRSGQWISIRAQSAPRGISVGFRERVGNRHVILWSCKL